MISIQEIKVGLVSAIVGGVAFAALCAIFHANDPGHLLLAAGAGVFTGLLAAPEFSPKTYKNPGVFQLLSGAVSGLLLGILFQWGFVGIVISTVVGAILGYTAKIWLDQVQVP